MSKAILLGKTAPQYVVARIENNGRLAMLLPPNVSTKAMADGLLNLLTEAKGCPIADLRYDAGSKSLHAVILTGGNDHPHTHWVRYL